MAYDLIPKPRQLSAARGGFTAGAGTVIFVSGAADTPGQFVAEGVESLTSFLLSVSFTRSEDYVLWLADKGGYEPLVSKAKKALERAGAGAEAYGLVVTPAGIAAAANAQAGLFYAAATLAQLADRREGRPFWPSCAISDRPDHELRAVHLDLKHHMEKLDYLASFVPRLASFKVNALVLELEDKFRYKRRPEIAAPAGFEPEELQAFTMLCRDYHVELIPLVQGLGHASYILKHPKYAKLREKKDSFAEFCPQQEGTYEVLFDLYEEVAEATQGTRYFHIGGDEAWLMGSCPRCGKALEKRSKFSLYEEWLDRCAGKVRELGRVPMVWDDMLIKDAGEDWSKLPKDLFYVRWNYRANAAETNKERIARYAESGLKVIVAAAIQTSDTYVPNYFREHFPNIEGFAKAAAGANLTGILTTAWEDSGNHTETFWPGYAGTGHVAWNAENRLDAEYMLAFTKVFHRASDGRLASVYKTLGDAAGPVWNLLAKEEPYKAGDIFPLPALVPAREGRRWRDISAARIEDAVRLAALLRETRKVLSREILSARRDNPYALEVLLASNRVMLARVDLFFALRDVELAVEDAFAAFAAGDRARAASLLHGAGVAVYDALGQGESALADLAALWELTRVPQDMSLFETADSGYLHDYANYLHLASRERDLSYFLYVERRMGAREMAGSLVAASEKMASAKAWPFAGKAEETGAVK